MGASACLEPPLFHLRNVLREEINVDLALDCHLLSPLKWQWRMWKHSRPVSEVLK